MLIASRVPVPYEEDDRDPTIWFLDHSYLENMFRMFKKVNGAITDLPDATNVLVIPCQRQQVAYRPGAAREHIVGWYSTGPRLREADLDITDLMANYCETPLLVICEVQASP